MSVRIVVISPRPLVAVLWVAALAAVLAALGVLAHDRDRLTLAPFHDAEKTLVIAIPAEPLRLDPHDTRDTPSALVNFHLYDRLVEVTPDGEIIPGLAESWQLLPDGVTYLFFLRRGVVFHDGTPLDADAVVANFRRLLAAGSTLSRQELLSPYVAEVSAVDTHTVAVRLARPFGPFLRHLAHESLGIVSPEAIEGAAGERLRHPSGTGPFQLEEWVPGDRVVLRSFDRHWRGKPFIERLVFRVIPDGGSRAIALEAGAADIVYPLDPVHLVRMKELPGITVESVPGHRVVYAALNLSHPPLDQQPVRQAMNFAVDVEAITLHLLFGLARRLDSPVAPATWGYAPVIPYRYAPAEAKRLLQEAGARFERPLQLWSPSARYLQDREVAEAIAGYLRAVGLDVEIRLFEWGTYLGLLQQSDEWDLAVLGWTPATGDADMALRPLYHSGARGNHSRYVSPTVDRLLDEAAFTLDAQERRRLYRELQAVIAREAPVIFLYAMDVSLGRRSEVDGVAIHPNEIVDLRRARKRSPGSSG